MSIDVNKLVEELEKATIKNIKSTMPKNSHLEEYYMGGFTDRLSAAWNKKLNMQPINLDIKFDPAAFQENWMKLFPETESKMPFINFLLMESKDKFLYAVISKYIGITKAIDKNKIETVSKEESTKLFDFKLIYDGVYLGDVEAEQDFKAKLNFIFSGTVAYTERVNSHKNQSDEKTNI